MFDGVMPGPNLMTLVTGVLIQAFNASNASLALSESTLPATHSSFGPELLPSRPYSAVLTLSGRRLNRLESAWAK